MVGQEKKVCHSSLRNKSKILLLNDCCIPTRVGNVVGGFQIVLDKFHGQPGMTCFGQNNVLPEHTVFSLDVNCVFQQGVVQGVGPQEGVVAQP